MGFKGEDDSRVLTKIKSMNIHQLSVTYVSEQDRILARINTVAGEELRLWLTRRLVHGLRPLLNRIVADNVAGVASADEQVKKMLAEFKKEESLQKADFQTPYRDQPAALPLGPEPLLVTEINVTPLPGGQLQLNFQEKLPGGQNPRGFQMALEQQLVHGFVHLLEQAVVQSEWGLAVATAEQTASVDDAAEAGEKPRYMN